MSVLLACLYVHCVYDAWYLWSNKGVNILLELELWMLLSHHVDAGSQTASSARTISALNCV